ncbi:MAG: addiction module protein [Syntrophobacteraceae bacterium]
MERFAIPPEIARLSVAERISVIEEIWNSIVAEQELLETAEAQKAELDRRIALCRLSPDEGTSWEEIKCRLKASKWGAGF